MSSAEPPPAPANRYVDHTSQVGNFGEHNWGISVSAINVAGGGLAPLTERIIHGIIRQALADAPGKGSVTRNVADLADPPKVRLGGSRTMTVWVGR